MKRQLYYGDNLIVLKESIKDESVDLIYLDPPFNSQKDYNTVFGADSQIKAFEDTWQWGEETSRNLDLLSREYASIYELLYCVKNNIGENSLSAYCVMMAPRLMELKRVLKTTGCIFLHCDDSASHYLKIIMDTIYGRDNFIKDLIWKRTGAHSGTKGFGRIHDNILIYSKTNNYTWNTVYTDYSPEYINEHFNHKDESGRAYQAITLTGPGKTKGDSGKSWRGIDPSEKGRHWAIPSNLPGVLEIPSQTQEALDFLDNLGRIHWPKKIGTPRLKSYLDEGLGVQAQDIILDIKPLSAHSAERLGYPTQKPVKLLERIIKSSSNIGDVVLDPFCGCGTAIEAAEKLERQWIGIDITHLAIALVEQRLNAGFRHVENFKYEVFGTPKDLDSAKDLASKYPFQFQYWACSLLYARPYEKPKSFFGPPQKGADGGVDGVIYFNDEGEKAKNKKIIISVKGGTTIGLKEVRELHGTMIHEKAPLGFFVTLTKPTRPMKTFAAASGIYRSYDRDVPVIQIVTIEDLLNSKYPIMPNDFTMGNQTFKSNKPVTSEKETRDLF
ncbi:MAG: restriction endonuclease [Deltaproteobacteria bacterium]|jgi:site-specific DNA-methyltransferase (adenine-specific)|nr:restriction endonuclease [Deltaproteobacteria bacterium]